MDRKQIAVIVLLIVAAGIGYYVLTLPADGGEEPTPVNGDEEPGEYGPPFAVAGENVTLEEFAANLLASDKVYIVEDLRGLDAYPLSKNNIMQCGVDFAGSEGVVGKEMKVYVLEDNSCSHTSGNATLESCYAEILSTSNDASAAIIWIEKGNAPEFYERGLLVRVNETYLQGACSIRPAQLEEEETDEEISDAEEELPPANESS
ncbi:MAG: hypothetical protein ACLFUZ_01830 [Candidatus Micrarchaeia archaeon]